MRTLVLGGYGAFGARIVERLAASGSHQLIVAGRDGGAAGRAVLSLAKRGLGTHDSASLDAAKITADDLRGLGVRIVVNASGPFQSQDYGVAEAAIGAGAHYIDLADARAFVCGISRLDAAARQAGVLVTSGASSVPAIAAAAIDAHLADGDRLRQLECAISPGNSFDPGLATTTSVLSGLGRPMQVWSAGRWQTRYGWQPLARRRIEGLGWRWLGHCDVPDHALFPLRYVGLGEQRFLAGVEVGLFHASLWALSWLVRGHLVRHPERLAAPMLALKRCLSWLGSDTGGMLVDMIVEHGDGTRRHIVWTLVARQGHGPYIPATPAIILARKLAAGTLELRGAVPCVGLLTLQDVTAEFAGLDIRQTVHTSYPGY